MEQPGFWDNQESAQKVVAELKGLRAQVEPVRDILGRVEEAPLLIELAAEQDACIIAVTHDEKILDRFDRLFHLRDGRLEDEGK